MKLNYDATFFLLQPQTCEQLNNSRECCGRYRSANVFIARVCELAVQRNVRSNRPSRKKSCVYCGVSMREGILLRSYHELQGISLYSHFLAVVTNGRLANLVPLCFLSHCPQQREARVCTIKKLSS